MGIEPTSSAWKAEVLPLNYTRINFKASSFSRADLLFLYTFPRADKNGALPGGH